VDGIELAMDSLLRGTRSSAAVPRDGKGHRLAAANDNDRELRAGHTVVLTINHALQDIAERALGDAVRRLGATGGDIVVLDPQSGEVLALASRRQDVTSTAATALTEPYEPGSTLKPFVAARLLALHRARADEVISTFGGKYTVQGRTINDVHHSDQLSLRDVIKWSSNVGIARFAERLSNAEEYDLLRDAGFGTPTGVPYPIESSGRLFSPHAWSKQSPASLAIGYELMVTPLQLATAYAAFANGGELLAPALVKEIRDPDGTVRYRHERRVVRRMMPAPIAAEVRGMLMDVVEGGTATAGELARYDVAGKSGSARRTTHGKYVAGSYTSSFVGLFPADAPQFVILVKLDNSRDGFFGGKVAAPVFRTVLEGAIAARGTSLDLDTLRRRARAPAPAERAADGQP
jgi:cell division protein FtsI (penicillin-binding protein 3)